MSPASGPSWIGRRLQRKALSVVFVACGERHETRVARHAGKHLSRARRRQGRPVWVRSVWRCGRPRRHEGPCRPGWADADPTDVLIGRWKARR